MEEQIKALRLKLTGNLFDDIETQQEIWALKKLLLAESGVLEEDDEVEDEDCLYCGS